VATRPRTFTSTSACLSVADSDKRQVRQPPAATTVDDHRAAHHLATSFLDSQQVEVVGRALVTVELTQDGLEVARPERDAGIDLIAFRRDPWGAVPIQLKVLSKPGFNFDPKYEHHSGLIFIYVWRDCSEFYALTWKQADKLITSLGYTRDSNGRWVTSAASAELKSALADFRVTAGGWADALGLPAL
jgi:hypothetical protein